MKADTDNHKKIFSSVSKCMREIKTLTVTKDEKKEDSKIFFTEKRQEDPRQERSRSNNGSKSQNKKPGRGSYRSKPKFNNMDKRED